MSSETVAGIISEEIEKAWNSDNLSIVKIPVADGGEGTVDCVLSALPGEKIYLRVKSPENKEIEAYYGVASDTAVIEIAQSSGITRQTSYNAKAATTYGFGQLIRDALDRGIRKFLLCLGGSATTDCGLGMAAALGAKFYDKSGNEFIPTGGTLSDVCDINTDGIDCRIQESEFTVMCDVENPLYGENGAAYVYGPQKGATAEDVLIMDKGLKSFSTLYAEKTGTDYSAEKGAGAAGGAGYACMTFLNATLKSGIEAMLEINNFDELVKDCDLVVTGEGKVDEQSFMGKVLSGVIRHSKDKCITAFCGICKINDHVDKQDVIRYNGIDIVEIGRGIPLEESIKNGSIYLRNAAKNYFEKEFVKRQERSSV